VAFVQPGTSPPPREEHMKTNHKKSNKPYPSLSLSRKNMLTLPATFAKKETAL
jgi:hypothetical protein